VLPDLRRAAAAAAEAGDAAEPVTDGLRQAIEDVEQLMHSRQSIVLEEYGLVAALEWLAERTETRTRLEVVVELEGASVDDPDALPKPVARAAFRVALLAIDNVVRHANATRALIRLIVDRATVDLVIADDGRGFDGDTAPRSGRGLIDMRTAANAVGATVTVEATGSGTRIAFRWPRAANPAMDPRDSTGGSRDVPG
jgi:two-component system NarL family sensor kinase